METVRIYRLTGLRPRYQARLRAAQTGSRTGSGRCAGICTSPPGSSAPPGRGRRPPAGHQRSVCPAQPDRPGDLSAPFWAMSRRRGNGARQNPKIRYPYKDKRYYPLLWPAQAVSRERGRIVLPMGRGRPSLVFHLDVPEQVGACKLVWKDGYELHVSVAAAPAERQSWLRPGHGGPGGDPPGGGDHHHGCSAGGVRPGHPLPQAAAQQGAGPDRQETPPVPERVTPRSATAGCPTESQRPQAPPDPGPASQGHPSGDRLLPASRVWVVSSSAIPMGSGTGAADGIIISA